MLMKGIVYAAKTENREEFVLKFLENFKDEIERTNRVFVKVNLVSWEPYPTTTHPDTLRAVLTFLEDLGVEFTVGDGPAVDAGDSNKIISEHPLSHVCKEFGIRLLNLYVHEMRKFTGPRGTELTLSIVPLKHDFVISLPVLKVHMVVGLTAALKNQYGYFSAQDRIDTHTGRKDIHSAIAEVNAIIKTNLFIVDCIRTLIRAQERRHGGNEAKLGYMIAGTDPVALDSLGFHLLQGVSPSLAHKTLSDIRYIRIAEEIGLGSSNVHKIINLTVQSF